MPAVRFTQSVAGHRFAYSAGEVVEFPEDEAKAWARSDVAELVARKTETPERRRNVTRR